MVTLLEPVQIYSSAQVAQPKSIENKCIGVGTLSHLLWLHSWNWYKIYSCAQAAQPKPIEKPMYRSGRTAKLFENLICPKGKIAKWWPITWTHLRSWGNSYSSAPANKCSTLIYLLKYIPNDQYSFVRRNYG